VNSSAATPGRENDTAGPADQIASTDAGPGLLRAAARTA
jgi:hypothetical protein